LVTTEGEQLLVEVKNVAPRDISKGDRMRLRDLEATRRYAEMTRSRLVLAHYWAAANVWTLIDASHVTTKGNQVTVKLQDAMKVNELGLLGDREVGTTPPLVLSLHPEAPEETHLDDSTGIGTFTVGRIAIRAGGRSLRSRLERSIAFHLMLSGGWQLEEESIFDGDMLVRHDYVFQPYDPEGLLAEQGFAIVTSLSSLHATRYTYSTLDSDGGFGALRVDPELGSLGALVPADYWEDTNRSLKLWMLQIQPTP
jgi:hypothetical protein